MYTNPFGKHSISVTNVVFVEYDELIPHMVDHLTPLVSASVLTEGAIANLSKVNLDDYAKLVQKIFVIFCYFICS